MVVWSNLETSCPVCGHRLRVRELGGGCVTGQDSDLLLRMEGKHIIQAEIHSCHNCRFAGVSSDFTDRQLTTSMLERFIGDVAPELEDEDPADDDRRESRRRRTRRTPLPHVQHHWSALAGRAIGLSSTEIGLRYVRAYWCLRLAPSCDLPEPVLDRLRRSYLREAIAHLRHGLRRERRREFVYLIAELCRRNGNFRLATRYFERYLTREEGPQYLKQAALKLCQAAHERDAGAKTMEEILFGDSDEGGAGKRDASKKKKRRRDADR